jgi:hypothetical protein
MACQSDSGTLLYKLVGADGLLYQSPVPGTAGGHARLRIFGRLDCPSALRFLSIGHYRKHRVFFADADVAIAAGYRPCARCLGEAHAAWKNPSLRAQSGLVAALANLSLKRNQ